MSCVLSKIRQKLEVKPQLEVYNQMADISLSLPLKKELWRNLCTTTVRDKTSQTMVDEDKDDIKIVCIHIIG